MDIQKEMTRLMLHRRGFGNVPDRDKYNNYFLVSNSINEIAIAYFVQFSKVSIDVIKTIFAIATEIGGIVKTIVIVYSTSLTPEAKNAVLLKTPFLVEPFTFDEMSYDLLLVVPVHSVAYSSSSREKPKDWFKYPVILSTDRVSRYMGFNKGDIIKIEEEFGLAYRKCV
jgi:hypothetical protein